MAYATMRKSKMVRVDGINVALRHMRAEDIDQVLEIEREAFSPLWVGTPFKRELNNRYARYLVAYSPPEAAGPSPQAIQEPEPIGEPSLWRRLKHTVQSVVKREPLQLESRGGIAGYVGIWFQGNEAHITEIAVRESLRSNGIGELLLIGSLRAALEYGSSVMTLEARVSNFVAQRLYEKYGFRSAGIRKGYYSDNREDAVIMTTSPIHSQEFQQMFNQLQQAYLDRWREISIEG
jgi:[ribosomal protein S18]-alanine N-acetyltransferase